jgi:hypothetical protein
MSQSDNRDPLRSVSLPRERVELEEKLNTARQTLKEYRKILREAEHRRDRAQAVARRYDGWLKVGWTTLNVGVSGLIVGVAAVFVNALTPLPLGGGPIVSTFLVFGLFTLASVIYLGATHGTDHTYVQVSAQGMNTNRWITRREFADWRRHQAEDALDDVTDAFTAVQELEAKLADARDQSS